MKATALKLSFTTDKPTKNTVRFKEDAPDGEEKVGSLYVKNSTLAELGNPAKLTVTIEAA